MVEVCFLLKVHVSARFHCYIEPGLLQLPAACKLGIILDALGTIRHGGGAYANCCAVTTCTLVNPSHFSTGIPLDTPPAKSRKCTPNVSDDEAAAASSASAGGARKKVKRYSFTMRLGPRLSLNRQSQVAVLCFFLRQLASGWLLPPPPPPRDAAARATKSFQRTSKVRGLRAGFVKIVCKYRPFQRAPWPTCSVLATTFASLAVALPPFHVCSLCCSCTRHQRPQFT